MAGIGHIAVGMAAGRIHAGRGAPVWKVGAAMAGYSLLSALPDVDVVGFLVGIPYHSDFGHRGAAHSLTFGVVTATAFSLVARLLGQPVRRTLPLALAVALSHPLLDTMTDGGHGIALLWPFDDARVFAPWRPIPVAPLMPTAWMSERGAEVVTKELLYFGPLLIYALWPRITRWGWCRGRGRSRPPERPPRRQARPVPLRPAPERVPASAPGDPRTPPRAPASSRASGAG